MKAAMFSSSILLNSLLVNNRQMSVLSSVRYTQNIKKLNFKPMASSSVSIQTPTTRAKTFVRPSPSVEAFKTERLINLTYWDLQNISENYLQNGFLYSELLTDDIITRLKSTLSTALYYFYSLNGRLVTENMDGGICISIDPNGGNGAEFIHERAYKKIKIEDLVQDEVPPVIYEFFPLNGAANYDGHSLPLLSVQVTELADGFFVGIAFNHCLGDALSFVSFVQSWANICRKGVSCSSDKEEIKSALVPGPPVVDRWAYDKEKPKIVLPYKHPDEFICRYRPPPNLKEKYLSFSSKKISEVRERANKECNAGSRITAFQAYFSVLWESITRAGGVKPEQEIRARIAANESRRLRPPLPKEYFGCASVYIKIETRAGRLLNEKWAGAKLLSAGVLAHKDAVIRTAMKKWHEAPSVTDPSGDGPNTLSVAGGTMVDLYFDYGWGKPVIIRSGLANKYDRYAGIFTGREGIGSIELELNLSSHLMTRLESDEEFMNMLS